MKSLTIETFNAWLEAYSAASRNDDPQASANLFSQNAMYYETPFDAPMLGRDAIRTYWEMGAQAFTDKKTAHEILAVQGNLGIARWRSNFKDAKTGQRLKLDCLLVVEFDENEKCKVFREWWHLLKQGVE